MIVLRNLDLRDMKRKSGAPRWGRSLSALIVV